MGTEVEEINLYTCNFFDNGGCRLKNCQLKTAQTAAFFFFLLQIEWLPLPCFTRCLLKFLVKGRPYLPPSCQICWHTASVRCVQLLKVNGRQSLKNQGRWERSWWVGELVVKRVLEKNCQTLSKSCKLCFKSCLLNILNFDLVVPLWFISVDVSEDLLVSFHVGMFCASCRNM